MGPSGIVNAIAEWSRMAVPATVTVATHGEAWDAVKSNSLTPWAAGQLDIDDDLLPPTEVSLRSAVAMADRLRGEGIPPPTDVLPNGDGGILFERRNGRASVQIDLLWDGSAEFVRYDQAGFVDADLIPVSAIV